MACSKNQQILTQKCENFDSLSMISELCLFCYLMVNFLRKILKVLIKGALFADTKGVATDFCNSFETSDCV